MTTSHTLSDVPAASQARMFKHGVILCLFCLGFGLLLAFTDEITQKDIGARAIEDKQNSLSQVLPDELHDNNPVTDTVTLSNAEGKELTVFRARKNGVVTGVAYEIFGTGYAGEIRLMMGIAADGKIEIKKTDWIGRFTGLALGNPPIERWKVKKDGGDFDQFAGATITPRGVMKAIRGGLEFFAENKSTLTKAD